MSEKVRLVASIVPLVDLFAGSSQNDDEKSVLDDDDNESVEDAEENREDDDEEDQDNVCTVIFSVSNTLTAFI